jgi:hypothetical protein
VPDPIELTAGVNLYSYVLARPTMLRDPFGLDDDVSEPPPSASPGPAKPAAPEPPRAPTKSESADASAAATCAAAEEQADNEQLAADAFLRGDFDAYNAYMRMANQCRSSQVRKNQAMRSLNLVEH